MKKTFQKDNSKSFMHACISLKQLSDYFQYFVLFSHGILILLYFLIDSCLYNNVLCTRWWYNKKGRQTNKSSPVICIKYACKLRGIVFQNVAEITSTDF